MLRTSAELKQLSWRWPGESLEDWRLRWASAFALKPGEVPDTAKKLASEMARLAKLIRGRVNAAMEVESEKGPLRRLHAAFRDVLLHDLDADGFADMYAQTITYGLFAARRSRPMGITAENARDMVPSTNPFLRDILGQFTDVSGLTASLDFDELGIDALVALLNCANIGAVVEDFGRAKPGEDPVIHFYEDFLSEYNRKQKIQRGIFYTPRPVVSYIVRSVHELLQTEFGLEDGLASTATWGEMLAKFPGLNLPEGATAGTPFVQVLDPAVGTGTFLVEVIDLIHKTMREKWRQQGHMDLEIPGLWNEYVPNHLLPRLYGFELMMAPYAIAHMKIGLKLSETGYRFLASERLRIYLTNSLEPAQDFSGQFDIMAPALAHEARAVNEVKRHTPFTVVVGNPPYAKSSQNQGRWIAQLMEEYKRTVRSAETQIQSLSDDYSKFLRLGHFALEQSRVGILGYINNNGFLDGPLFRDMRSSMLAFFEGIRILNLHGDSRKRFSPPDGKADENIFDIQQGVAATVMWRKEPPQRLGSVGYVEVWGSRQDRYKALQSGLASHIKFEPLQPTPTLFLFIPIEKEAEAEYQAGWHLYDVFGTGNREADNHESYGAGFVTQQDRFAIGFSEVDVADNVCEFLNSRAREDALWEKFEFCSTNQWNFDRAKAELKGLDIRRLTRRCLYRPFDYRFTVFDRNVVTIARKRITSQFDEPNMGLLTTRRVTRLPFNNVFATKHYARSTRWHHTTATLSFFHCGFSLVAIATLPPSWKGSVG